MTTQTTEVPTKAAISVPAPITAKFNIALTESKFQALADEAGKLEYTEDNVETIADFLKKSRGVIKKIEETHKSGKEEALLIGRQWDTAKNTFIQTVEAITKTPQEKYTALCKSIQQKKDDELKQQQRVANIKKLIDDNLVEFAKQIASSKTAKELTAVESTINLELTRKEKYQEFLPDAKERFKELNQMVKNHKQIVKNLEEIERKRQEALTSGDEGKAIELGEAQADIHKHMEEQKVVVQETVISRVTSSPDVTPVTTILPNVKARRTTWKFELADKKEAMKKAPDLLDVVLNDEKVKTVLQTLKDTKALDGKKELTLNGIRYYLSETF